MLFRRNRTLLGSWRKIVPRFYRCYPTLRGLKQEKACIDGVPETIPWTQVERKGHFWRAVDMSGYILRNNAGRGVLLSISNPYEEMIAQRAQRRSIRTGIENESIQLEDKMPNLHWLGLFVIVNGLGMGIMSWEPFRGAVRLLGGTIPTHLQGKHQALLVALSLLFVLFAVVMSSFAIGTGFWLLLQGRVVRLRLTGSSLTTIHRGGHQRTNSLRKLQSFGISGLRFHGGGRLPLFFASSRVVMVGREAWNLFGTQTKTKHDATLQRKKTIWRIVAFSAILALGAYYLVDYLGVPDSEGYSAPAWGVSLIVLALGLVTAIGLSSLPARALRKYHRHSIRKKRRTARHHY